MHGDVTVQVRDPGLEPLLITTHSTLKSWLGQRSG